MGVNENTVTALLVVAGLAVASVGFALVYLPLGIIAAGASLVIVGTEGRRRT
jgi:hypothetical protein